MLQNTNLTPNINNCGVERFKKHQISNIKILKCVLTHKPLTNHFTCCESKTCKKENSLIPCSSVLAIWHFRLGSTGGRTSITVFLRTQKHGNKSNSYF